MKYIILVILMGLSTAVLSAAGLNDLANDEIPAFTIIKQEMSVPAKNCLISLKKDDVVKVEISSEDWVQVKINNVSVRIPVENTDYMYRVNILTSLSRKNRLELSAAPTWIF